MATRVQRFYLAIVLFLAGLTLHGAHGAEVNTSARDDTLSLLATHRFAELDLRYGAIQRQYKDGKISDEDLRAAFRVFYATEAALEPHYAAWVRESPKSYVAHLARGIYYKRVAAERRGGKFISETSPEQIAGMEAAYEVAGRELDASLAFDSKPLLTYMHSMDLSGNAGDRAAARRLLDAAVAIDPKNMIVREKYMVYLQTRWGGSVEEMRSFLHECRAAGLSSVQLKDLEEMVVEDEAWVHRYRDGDVDTAVHDYLRAAKLNPKASCEPCGPLVQAGDALFDAKNYAEAIKLYSQVLRHDPTSIHALNNRAYSELQLNQPKAAVADLERAAGMNDAYAQDMLGRMYLVGTSIPQDRDKAIAWLKKAAEQNYEPAKKLLPMALNKDAQPLPIPGSPRF